MLCSRCPDKIQGRHMRITVVDEVGVGLQSGNPAHPIDSVTTYAAVLCTNCTDELLNTGRLP